MNPQCDGRRETNQVHEKGLCFRCKKPRHISRDCPEKKGAKELVMHIRTLTVSMDDKEKEEFFEAAEEEGF